VKTKSLAFLVLFSSCLAANTPSWAANSDVSSPDIQVGITDTTKKELLMFYEETDLVTATKRATPLRKAPAIATIITAEEIKNMGARNLLDVLKMVPGFGISTSELGLNMVEVRGIRTALSEKILLMIDGHSLNRNYTGSAFYQFAEKLPVENIKQVEIVRGPGSALYGNSAFVATINIITRDADEINGVEVKAGGGSFDTYKGDIIAGKSYGDKLSVMGSLDYVNTRGAKLNVQSDVLGASGTPDLRFHQTDTFLKIGYGDFFFRGGYRTARQYDYIGIAYALTDNSYTDMSTYWGELAYGLRLADTLSANMKVYYDHWQQDPFAKILPNGFPGFPDGMIGKPLTKDRTLGTEFQVDWDLFKGNHLILGTSFEEMQQYDTKQIANFDPTNPIPTPLGSMQEVANWNKDATRRIFALYLQDEWQIIEKLNFTAGVRYDHYNDFGDTTNPRVGLVWNFLENADLKLLYGQAFRAPTFVELYDANNPVVIGNSNLKPEKIKTYEAGLAYRFAQWLGVDLNYFYSAIDDLIDWDRAMTPGVFSNTGKAKTQGVETGLHGAIIRDLRWKLAYTYQDARNDITGDRLPYVPSQRANGSVNYAMNRYLNLHTDVLWTGPRPRAVGETRPESPSYTVVDLAVTGKNFIKNFEIQASIHNIFDERFFDPDTSGALNKVPGDFPREGISAFVTGTYRF
jgi:iron complex outermembrane receptor protein